MGKKRKRPGPIEPFKGMPPVTRRSPTRPYFLIVPVFSKSTNTGDHALTYGPLEDIQNQKHNTYVSLLTSFLYLKELVALLVRLPQVDFNNNGNCKRKHILILQWIYLVSIGRQFGVRQDFQCSFPSGTLAQSFPMWAPSYALLSLVFLL